MPDVTRKKIFELAAAKLRQDFSELSTIPHSGLKGGEAENLVRAFLAQHIPRRFGVGAGFVIDPQDKVSRQNDVIIYDELNCPVYRASEDAAIFPSDNVAAVVEVKSRLTKRELRDGFEKIADVKSLAKSAPPEGRGGPLRQQTMGCIFAFESEITLETVAQEYGQLVGEFGIGRHPDLVIVLDRGVLTLACKMRGLSEWGLVLFLEGFGGQAGEGSHLGLAVHEIGSESLDYFLRLLLACLVIFRPVVAHPGFQWATTPAQGQMKMLYLTSITTEEDPEIAQLKLKKYAAEVEREFGDRPSWGSTASEGSPELAGGDSDAPEK